MRQSRRAQAHPPRFSGLCPPGALANAHMNSVVSPRETGEKQKLSLPSPTDQQFDRRPACGSCLQAGFFTAWPCRTHGPAVRRPKTAYGGQRIGEADHPGPAKYCACKNGITCTHSEHAHGKRVEGTAYTGGQRGYAERAARRGEGIWMPGSAL